MRYEEVKSYIESIPKFTTKNTKSHTKRFMELLGSPEENAKIIHVAGTNGKGSTCMYINSILLSMGLSTGVFTSPHLLEMTERIKVNGVDIEEIEFVEAYENVIVAVRQMELESMPHPTFFEFILGMAMSIFAAKKVEYLILETGLGGRLDATNIVENPIINCITTIDLDHTQYLGNTIEKIATEKAGIIKKDAIVVYDGTNEIVCNVIEEICEKKGNRSRKIAEDAYEILRIRGNSIDFCLKNSYDKDIIWRLSTTASYQVMNASIAITALKEWFQPDDSQLDMWKMAIRNTVWAGRMEEVESGIYLDGAHNLNALEAVVKDATKWDVILFSAVTDKSYEEMIKYLCENAIVSNFVITEINDERGADAEEMYEIFKRYTKAPIIVERDFEKAWNIAKSKRSNEGKMLCMGSLYLVGMAKKVPLEGEKHVKL